MRTEIPSLCWCSISSSLLSLAFSLSFLLVPLVAFVSFLAFLVIFRDLVLLSEDSSASTTEAFRHADERAFPVLLPGMMRSASSVFFFFGIVHGSRMRELV